MWCTISRPQVLGSPDCTERLQAGPRGGFQISDCRGRNKLGLQPQRSQPSEIVKAAVAARKQVRRGQQIIGLVVARKLVVRRRRSLGSK